jgi:UDP-glucose 4-epimerase
MAAQPLAWITGASGFIAGHVTAEFRRRGWTVLGIDRVPHADAHVTAEVSETSLADALRKTGAPQAIFHGAGNGSVGRSIADPSMCRRDTLDSTLTLLDFLKRNAPACRLVFPSSAAIYGASDKPTLAEDCPPNPVSPYGAHKLAAEEACRTAAAAGQPIAILRMFSVYGPGLRKQLPWDLGQRILAGEDPITLFGTGNETRDFLAVADAARLIVDLATTDRPSPVIVNGGTGKPTTVAAFAAQLAAALGAAPHIAFNGEVRAGDPQAYCADVTKLSTLDFTPAVSLTQGLADYARWLKSTR